MMGKKYSEEVMKAISKYICSGCVCGSSIQWGNFTPYNEQNTEGSGCEKNCPVTSSSIFGKFFLGMPKGFCRLGPYVDLKIKIFENFDIFEETFGYDKFNVPVSFYSYYS